MTEKSKNAASEKQQLGFFARIALFWRQVIDELKKVVYPTRNELWTYFAVVIVFVLIVMAFVGVVDVFSQWIIGLVFGTK